MPHKAPDDRRSGTPSLCLTLWGSALTRIPAALFTEGTG